MLVWKAHTGKVRSLTFSPDGRRVATTAGNSKFVWLWDATAGRVVRKLADHGREHARAVAFFPDGRHVAANFEYGGPTVWETETGKVVAKLAAPEGCDPDSLAVSPDGSRLLVCGSRGTDGLAVWDDPTRPTGTTARAFDRAVASEHHAPSRLGFSPLGTWFCVAEWFLRLHDPTTLREVRAFRDPAGASRLGASATAFAFTPDETRLAIALGLRAVIWRLDQPDARPVHIRGHGNLVKAVGFLPGATTLLTAGMDGTARVWDAATGAEMRSFDWKIGKVQAAAISPDGTLCAAGGDDGRIVVWDVD